LTSFLLFTAVVPHNNCFMHTLHSIQSKTVTEGFQNEKWYIYILKHTS